MSALPSACLVDSDHPCGSTLVEDEDGACRCPTGSVLQAGDCVECGEHEQPVANTCECVEGYVRDGTDCIPAPPPCEGDDCPCERSSDCADSQLCDVHDTLLCIPKPDGLGAECSSDADCADSEATYCEVLSSNTCQIQGCAERGGVCPGDMGCCDFQILGTSLCLPASSLVVGSCPAPGQLIPREEE